MGTAILIIDILIIVLNVLLIIRLFWLIQKKRPALDVDEIFILGLTLVGCLWVVKAALLQSKTTYKSYTPAQVEVQMVMKKGVTDTLYIYKFDEAPL